MNAAAEQSALSDYAGTVVLLDVADQENVNANIDGFFPSDGGP
jgi:hypothetical protein